MKAQIKDGKLLLELELAENPAPSKSGKTLVVASTHGAQKTGTEWKEKEVVVVLTAYTYR